MHSRLILSCLLVLVSSAAVAKNSKRGLTFAEGDNPGDIKKANQTGSVISWQYDWGVAAPDYLAKSTITYIPMIWGTNGIETFAARVKSSGAKTILVGLFLYILSCADIIPGVQRT